MQNPVILQTRKSYWRLAKHRHQGLKPSSFTQEFFRGFENPLPGLKVRGWHPSAVVSKFEMTLGHIRDWPVPFNGGCAVASTEMSTEYEVILLTSEEGKMRCEAEAILWQGKK